MENMSLKTEKQVFTFPFEISRNKEILKFNFQYFNNKYFYYTMLIFIFLLINISSLIIKNDYIYYKKYINDCSELKSSNTTKVTNNKSPYLSICIPVYNMELYIERAISSILHQSFQDFEIIITNDNSNDKSLSIIQNLQSEDNRITIINHNQNLGVYSSRVDAILNSKGKYIILMDPDDMFLNQELFENLYNYNLQFNLDIIEFSVIYKENKKRTIYKPRQHYFNHYHDFRKDIIYQPELSNIYFFIPKTSNITSIICRTIWNKLIRKNILLKTVDYINVDFKNEFLITADDTPFSLIVNQNANNYSNIKLPGYLYNLRKNSMSRVNNGDKHSKIVSINYLLFNKFFYRYIRDYKKELNFLFKDMENSYSYLLKFKEYKINEYFPILNSFLNEVAKNDNASYKFKAFLYQILDFLNDK